MINWLLSVLRGDGGHCGRSGLPLEAQNYIDIRIRDGLETVKEESRRFLTDQLKQRWGPWDRIQAYINAFCILLAVASWFGVRESLRKTAEKSAQDMARSLFALEMTNQIKVQFQEPRVSNIVVSVATSEATNLLNREIAPHVAAVEQRVQSVETNLDNVVSDFFDKVELEGVSVSDSNRVTVVAVGHGVSRVYVVLRHAPILKSVQGVMRGPGQVTQPMVPVSAVFWNVGMWYFRPRPDAQSEFIIHYARAARTPNLLDHLEVRGQEVWSGPIRLKD